MYILAGGNLVEQSGLPNRNAEIVTHMCKMRLQNFEEEENMIRKEIDGKSSQSFKLSQQAGSDQQTYCQPEENLSSQKFTNSHGSCSKVTTTRRLIRIDDIEIVKEHPGLYFLLLFKSFNKQSLELFLPREARFQLVALPI